MVHAAIVRQVSFLHVKGVNLIAMLCAQSSAAVMAGASLIPCYTNSYANIFVRSTNPTPQSINIKSCFLLLEILLHIYALLAKILFYEIPDDSKGQRQGMH